MEYPTSSKDVPTTQPSGCASLAEAKALDATVSACSSGGVRFKTSNVGSAALEKVKNDGKMGKGWGKDRQVEGWWMIDDHQHIANSGDM